MPSYLSILYYQLQVSTGDISDRMAPRRQTEAWWRVGWGRQKGPDGLRIAAGDAGLAQDCCLGDAGLAPGGAPSRGAGSTETVALGCSGGYPPGRRWPDRPVALTHAGGGRWGRRLRRVSAPVLISINANRQRIVTMALSGAAQGASHAAFSRQCDSHSDGGSALLCGLTLPDYHGTTPCTDCRRSG